jgi:hypothetical protein
MSYVAGLLANATPAQLRRVMEMKAEDWQQYKHDHFMRLVALLELVNRPSCLQDFDHDMPNEQQEQQQHGQQQKVAAGSRSSAASGNTTAAPAGQQDPAVPAAGAAPAAAHGSGLETFDIFRRFQDVVDEGITLSFLALFFNHLSITQASTNADLPQQAAPPGLWMRVVRKLDLTKQQLLQLRLASEEFTRLNRSCSQEAETLMGRANRPSLLLAAEASIQAAASASQSQLLAGSASGGSGSSASASGGCGVSYNNDTRSAGVPASGSGADSSGRDSAGAAAAAAPTGAAAAAAADEEAAAAAAASEDDEEGEGHLDDLLQRHLRLRFLYMVMIGMFVFNTLSRVQIAQMTVG